MTGIGRTLVWWDRDIDQAGRPIRADVRSAGHEIWRQAYQRTHAVLSDYGPAAELMEKSVAQVSRYLDRIGAPQSPGKHGLLMVAFCRGLRRYAAHLNRLEFVGGSGELASRAFNEAWASQMEASLELARIVRKLRGDNAAALMLRATGYEWDEVGKALGKSSAAIRISFWREIRRVRRISSCRQRLPDSGDSMCRPAA
jgi:DNA-directed RNA polymerase specialized sigma24 family protein